MATKESFATGYFCVFLFVKNCDRVKSLFGTSPKTVFRFLSKQFSAVRFKIRYPLNKPLSNLKGGYTIMAERTIHITKFDMDRLVELIEGLRLSPKANRANLDLLEKELYRGMLVDPQNIPQDVITMNSKVSVTDTTSGEKMTYTLVFPSAANITDNKLSILAPLGMALLGYRMGDIIEWSVPSGIRKLRVDEIVYQPEAAGDYHL